MVGKIVRNFSQWHLAVNTIFKNYYVVAVTIFLIISVIKNKINYFIRELESNI